MYYAIKLNDHRETKKENRGCFCTVTELLLTISDIIEWIDAILKRNFRGNLFCSDTYFSPAPVDNPA